MRVMGIVSITLGPAPKQTQDHSIQDLIRGLSESDQNGAVSGAEPEARWSGRCQCGCADYEHNDMGLCLNGCSVSKCKQKDN